MDLMHNPAETRQKGYMNRSRRARDLARLCVFLIVLFAMTAAWSDETTGPIMRSSIESAIAWLDKTSDDLTGPGGLLGPIFARFAG